MKPNGPPTVTSAIQYFLTHNSPNSPDLAALYNPGMEVQINVARLDGEPVEGHRNTYEDGETRWWNIRIPKGADKDPNWNDYPLRFSLSKYAHSIGMSGWNWQERRSYFVGYDFDSIVGHAPGVGVTPDELKAVKDAVAEIPWIETRLSTGGTGLHLYVYFDNPPETETHTEHAALARAILGVMAKEAAFDLAASMDVCGNILWCFRKDVLEEGSQGLKLIKPVTEKFTKIPVNWRDNVAVISRQARHVRVQGLVGLEHEETPFEELARARQRIPLEASHKAVMEDLENSGYSSIWVADHWLLQTHTVAIKDLATKYAGEGRPLKGFFDTLSGGADPSKPNCFLFPMKDGAWRVFRFGIGAIEAPTWDQAPNGWTQCYLNQAPSLEDAAHALGGIEDGDKPGTYIFETGLLALEAVKAMGKTLDIPKALHKRQTSLAVTKKGGRLHIKVVKKKSDDEDNIKMPGWLAKKTHWTRLETVVVPDLETSPEHYEHDNFVRFCWQDKTEAGWAIQEGGVWKNLRKDNARTAFRGLGFSGPETEKLLGEAFNDPWTLTTKPFTEEYPGGRIWNRFAPQWTYQPANLPADVEPYHPHWDMVLNHSGYELNQPLKHNPWAQQNGIFTGGDYLLHWTTSALREPEHHLPYLFLWGPQSSGKSIFGDALALLISDGAVGPANAAITSSGGFNSELRGVIIARVEEIDLREAGGKYYNRVKDWVTSETFQVHQKGQQPYTIPNYLKFIHTANNKNFSPIWPGDSRITTIWVPALKVVNGKTTEIPKPQLLKYLRDEAPHFMTTIMRTVLPPMTTRLRIPVVETASKQTLTETAMNPLQRFLYEKCFHVPGNKIDLTIFVDTFQATLTPIELTTWTRNHVKQELEYPYVYGNDGRQRMFVANVSFQEPTAEEAAKAETAPDYFVENGQLRLSTPESPDTGGA